MNKELIAKLNGTMDIYEKKVFNELLVAHNIRPSVFKQVVLTEIKKSPKMLDAFVQNPSSMFAAIIFSAQLGLMPSESLGQFFMKLDYDKNNGYIIKPIIGYQGLVSILQRDGNVQSIWAESVHEGDEFTYELGLEPKLTHIPSDPIRTSMSLTYVYVVSKLKNGEKQFKVMSRSELLSTINLQKERNDLYFNDQKDPNFWMLKKIVLKQLAKFLPKDYLGTFAIQMDNALEGGNKIELNENNEIEIVKEEQSTKRVKSMYEGIEN